MSEPSGGYFFAPNAPAMLPDEPDPEPDKVPALVGPKSAPEPELGNETLLVVPGGSVIIGVAPPLPAKFTLIEPLPLGEPA